MKRQYRLPGAEIQNGTRAVLAHAPLGARKPCTLTKKRPPASHSRPPLGKSYVPPCSPLKRTKTAVKRYSERLIIPRPSLKNAAARAKTPQHLRLSAGGVYTGRASSPHLPGGRHTKHISHSTAPRIIRCLPRRRRISPVRRRPYIRCASRATQQGFHPHKPYEPIQHIGTSESGRNATKSIVTLKKRGGNPRTNTCPQIPLSSKSAPFFTANPNRIKDKNRMRSDMFYTEIGAENRFSHSNNASPNPLRNSDSHKKCLPTAYISKQAAVCVDYPFRSIINKRRSKSIGKHVSFRKNHSFLSAA